jgi:glycosyl transferase, family 25
MKLFIINLDRQPERLGRMKSLFEGLGLQFSRVSAVDGKRLSEEEIRRWQSEDVGSRQLRAGETACFLSHRECWQRIVDEGLPHAAIFEDDLHLGEDAAVLLRSGTWVPEEADIIKIETKLQYARVDRSPVGQVGGRTLNRLRSRHAGAGGYIVTRNGAEKLLRMSETFSSPADQFIFNLDLPSARSLAIYQLLPAVCVQDFVVKETAMIVGLGSDLHDERTGEKLKGASKLWREVKRPFVQLGDHIARLLSNASPDKKWVFVRFS